MSLDLASPTFATALAGAFVAGLVRGFSGFGAAMVLVPILAATFGPRLAVPVLTLLDLALTAPIAWRLRRRCAPREVLPLMAGHALALPVGIMVLVTADPEALRRAMGALVLAVALLMALGWRRRTAPGSTATVAVGGAAGFLSGATGIGGPPVVLFWLSGQDGAPRVRANIFVFFTLTGTLALAGFAVAGLVTAEALRLALMLGPAYAAGLLLGGRVFGRADERLFRPAALLLIAAIGVVSLV